MLTPAIPTADIVLCRVKCRDSQNSTRFLPESFISEIMACPRNPISRILSMNGFSGNINTPDRQADAPASQSQVASESLEEDS